MDKSDYRTLLNNIKPFIKLSYFCKKTGITSSQMSMFLKGREFDYQISKDKLDKLIIEISSTLSKEINI